MPRIIVTTWTTLDGFAAGPNGEMEWVGRSYDEAMGNYEMALVEAAGTLLLGRTTYESFAGSWPHVADNPDVSDGERAYARRLNAMRKVVVSSSLPAATWEGTEVLRAFEPQAIERLKAESDGDIVVYGSLRLVRGLTEAGLVDEYQVLVHPVLLGEGRSIGEWAAQAVELGLVAAEPHPSGVVRLTYRRA
jgi:dihydrofolate reductase